MGFFGKTIETTIETTIEVEVYPESEEPFVHLSFPTRRQIDHSSPGSQEKPLDMVRDHDFKKRPASTDRNGSVRNPC